MAHLSLTFNCQLGQRNVYDAIERSDDLLQNVQFNGKMTMGTCGHSELG